MPTKETKTDQEEIQAYVKKILEGEDTRSIKDLPRNTREAIYRELAKTQSEYDTNAGNLQRLKSAEDELKIKIDGLQNEEYDFGQETPELKEKIFNDVKERQDLQAKVKELESQITQLRTEQSALDLRIRRINNFITDNPFKPVLTEEEAKTKLQEALKASGGKKLVENMLKAVLKLMHDYEIDQKTEFASDLKTLTGCPTDYPLIPSMW